VERLFSNHTTLKTLCPKTRMHVYEIRPRKDHRGVDLISDALPSGRLWYGEPNAISNAIGYAKFYSRSHNAVIRVYDDARNVMKAHEHKGEFQRVVKRYTLEAKSRHAVKRDGSLRN
jgi:hypothetical protein